MRVLERGKESAIQMRRLLDHHHHHDHHHHQDVHDDHDVDGGCLKLKLKGQVDIDAHSLEVLTSFATALSMIHYSFPSSFDDHHDHDHDHQGSIKSPNPPIKSRVFEDWKAPNPPKDARRSYKRRKIEQSMEIETSNMDDGHAWRKYGQKVIQNTKHPRNYYRCTHKTEQGCQATKQVQQISENPLKYKIIYHGHHRCKNPLKTPPMYNLDLIDDQDDSSKLLSFEKLPNNPKHGLNPIPLPSSSSSSISTPSSSSSPVINAMLEKEYRPIMHEIPSEPSDHHHEAYIQCPSSSSSSDLTTTTFAADDVISLAELYFSAVSPHNVEVDYSYVHDGG